MATGYPSLSIDGFTQAETNEKFVQAGYGGIGQDAIVAIPSPTSTFTSLEFWDVPILLQPKNVTQDFANNYLSPKIKGIWEIHTKISIEFDEVNAGRRMRLRFFDSTSLVAGGREFVFGIARNVDTATLSITFLINIGEALLNSTLQVQAATDDTFTNMVAIGSVFEMKHVGEAV